MDFALDQTTVELRERLLAFMDEFVYPAEPLFREQVEGAGTKWDTPPIIEELKAEARARGLWNLFLPANSRARRGPDQPPVRAAGRDHRPQPLDRARGAQLLGPGHRQHGAAVAVRDAEQQKREWLEPLLEGTIRSAFSMTEPDVASSDATNIATRIERDGDST